ncbi:MAG: hypothetical protein ABW019_12630 [Chitinophagaceae bacterium]
MDLRATLLAEHSRAQTDTIVKWIGRSQQRFDELFGLFISEDYRITQRAAWPLSYAVKNHPGLINRHLGKLIKNLQKEGTPAAVRRNTVRILQDIPVPRRYHGDMMNTCFAFIASPEEPVAVKAFSLTILGNLVPLYPDIKNELKLVIEERWEHESAAFHSRARKILNKL